jgi:uncharacterized protein
MSGDGDHGNLLDGRRSQHRPARVKYRRGGRQKIIAGVRIPQRTIRLRLTHNPDRSTGDEIGTATDEPATEAVQGMTAAEEDRRLIRARFLNISGLFQTGMVLFALGLSWLLDVDPLERILPRWDALGLALLGLAPLALFFYVSFRFPIGGLTPIREFLIETLGPLLVPCSAFDLLLLASMVGFSEELLFRGVIQPWLGQWGVWVGLLGCSVLFGLAHAVTPTYAIIAALVGLYLGGLLEFCRPSNLVVPVLVHALYDWLAFLVVRRTYQQESTSARPSGD